MFKKGFCSLLLFLLQWNNDVTCYSVLPSVEVGARVILCVLVSLSFRHVICPWVSEVSVSQWSCFSPWWPWEQQVCYPLPTGLRVLFHREERHGGTLEFSTAVIAPLPRSVLLREFLWSQALPTLSLQRHPYGCQWKSNCKWTPLESVVLRDLWSLSCYSHWNLTYLLKILVEILFI